MKKEEAKNPIEKSLFQKAKRKARERREREEEKILKELEESDIF